MPLRPSIGANTLLPEKVKDVFFILSFFILFSIETDFILRSNEITFQFITLITVVFGSLSVINYIERFIGMKVFFVLCVQDTIS